MFLGIDLGTSGVKVLLMDAAQQVIGSANMGLTVARPHPGWSEQAPQDWVTAATAALDQLARGHDLSRVEGIGLSGQMHGAVTLDRAGQVLRPAILWNDGRADAQAARLDADPRFRKLTGNIVFPGFTAPKLVWMAAQEPALFEQIAKVLLPKDYLRLWLSGDYLAEMSDASGTSWLDVGRRAWSAALLEASGMRLDQMPDLVEGSAPAGQLRHELAERWGMRPSTVIAGGAGDNAATAIGAGTVAEGQGFVSLGTSGVLFAATDSFRPRPESAVHAFCHALPEMWHQMGVILSAAASVEWLGVIAGEKPAQLVAALGDHLDAPGEVLFLPYLSGERTPHNDVSLRGSFSGLSTATSRADLTRAVLEGVAFALADNLLALRQAGSDPQALLALGGGANSAYWRKIIATVLDLPLMMPESGDFGAAFGAARLGMMAATGASAQELCQEPRIIMETLPDPDLADAYAEKLAQYRALAAHQLKAGGAA